MILLTGFESYGGRTANPSQAVVERLDGKTTAAKKIVGVTLPVDYAALRQELPRLIDELAPDIMISLGLWPGEPMIRLERLAVNAARFEIADNTGLMLDERIAEDRPTAYETTLPLPAIRDALRAEHLPCRFSSTAGLFLCNALMYTALDHCAQKHPQTRCGFIHLPYLPGQVAQMLDDLEKGERLELHQRSDLASMSLETMVSAVKTAVDVTLRDGAA